MNYKNKFDTNYLLPRNAKLTIGKLVNLDITDKFSFECSNEPLRGCVISCKIKIWGLTNDTMNALQADALIYHPPFNFTFDKQKAVANLKSTNKMKINLTAGYNYKRKNEVVYNVLSNAIILDTKINFNNNVEDTYIELDCLNIELNARESVVTQFNFSFEGSITAILQELINQANSIFVDSKSKVSLASTALKYLHDDFESTQILNVNFNSTTLLRALQDLKKLFNLPGSFCIKKNIVYYSKLNYADSELRMRKAKYLSGEQGMIGSPIYDMPFIEVKQRITNNIDIGDLVQLYTFRAKNVTSTQNNKTYFYVVMFKDIKGTTWGKDWNVTYTLLNSGSVKDKISKVRKTGENQHSI